ncbi:hypothetical protein D3C72_1477250 [compost metagenome]
MDRIGNIDRLALADRLAAVEAFHDRQFVPVALEQLGEFQQDFLALRRCELTPTAVFKGFPRLGDCVVDIACITRRDIGEFFAGGRVGRDKCLAGFGRNEGAVDEGVGGQLKVCGNRPVFGGGQRFMHDWLPT